MKPKHLPVVALTLGDPAGIGPELIAKLLNMHELVQQANVVLVGDPWLWAEGQKVAGLSIPTEAVHSFDAVRQRAHPERPAFLVMDTVDASKVTYGVADVNRCSRYWTVAWRRLSRVTLMPSVLRP